MKALTWLVAIVSGLWFGYWWIGSTAVQNSVEKMLANPPAGVTLAHDSVQVEGFPNRFDLSVTAPSFSDPAAGIAWKAPFLQVFSMTWKPWHFIAALPHTQEFTIAGDRIDLASARLVGSLLLKPGVDLALNEATIEGETLALGAQSGWGLTLGKVVLASREDPSLQNTHRIGVEASSLVLGPQLMAKIAEAGLPPEISELHLDSYASLSAPIDRHAGETRPRLTAFDLREAHLTWGNFAIAAKGKLSAGPDGVAEGEIVFDITNWRNLPPLLVAVGAIPPGFAKGLTSGFEAMTKAQTDPDKLTLTLKAAAGRLSLGPFPLGPAPKFN